MKFALGTTVVSDFQFDFSLRGLLRSDKNIFQIQIFVGAT